MTPNESQRCYYYTYVRLHVPISWDAALPDVMGLVYPLAKTLEPGLLAWTMRKALVNGCLTPVAQSMSTDTVVTDNNEQLVTLYGDGDHHMTGLCRLLTDGKMKVPTALADAAQLQRRNMRAALRVERGLYFLIYTTGRHNIPNKHNVLTNTNMDWLHVLAGTSGLGWTEARDAEKLAWIAVGNLSGKRVMTMAGLCS